MNAVEYAYLFCANLIVTSDPDPEEYPEENWRKDFWIHKGRIIDDMFKKANANMSLYWCECSHEEDSGFCTARSEVEAKDYWFDNSVGEIKAKFICEVDSKHVDNANLQILKRCGVKILNTQPLVVEINGDTYHTQMKVLDDGSITFMTAHEVEHLRNKG